MKSDGTNYILAHYIEVRSGRANAEAIARLLHGRGFEVELRQNTYDTVMGRTWDVIARHRGRPERPETIECGSNILSGAEPETVLRCLQTALALRGAWSPPREYLVENVSDTVVKIALSFIHR